MRIGFEATRIAIAGYVVPFMAVYAPALMLQPGGPLEASVGLLPAAAYVLLKAVIAVGLWGAAAGYLLGPLGWVERAVAVVAASFLDRGAARHRRGRLRALGLFVAWHWWRTRTLAPRPA